MLEKVDKSCSFNDEWKLNMNYLIGSAAIVLSSSRNVGLLVIFPCVPFQLVCDEKRRIKCLIYDDLRLTRFTPL